MKTQISGTIKSIPINRGHVEPLSYISIGEIQSGETKILNLGFENTGNIAQNIEMLSMYNFVNCSFISGHFEKNHEIQEGQLIQLLPGETGIYVYEIKSDIIPVGSDPLDLSLEAEWIWS